MIDPEGEWRELENAGAVVDTYTAPCGVRSFAFDANSGFSLNGTKLKLNGVCLHHDLGRLGGGRQALPVLTLLAFLIGSGVVALNANPRL